MSKKRKKAECNFDPILSTEDRIISDRHVRKAATLVAMLAGPQTVGALIKATTEPRNGISSHRFVAAVLDGLRDSGLVEPGEITRYMSDMIWWLTPAGRTEGMRLQRLRTAQAALAAQTPSTRVAGPRAHLYLNAGLPPGEYRVIRPGAYDHESWPSRVGEWLRYRDGRVVHVSERAA